MADTSYKIAVNEQFSFEVDPNQLLDSIQTGQRSFHILHENKSYQAEIVSLDMVTKQIDIRLNGNIYTATISDPLDQLVKRMGLAAAMAQKVSDVKAPMPGLVLSIDVKEGQEVEKDTPLLVLEAMKMENLIKSPGEGIVKTIHIEKGNSVEKNQLLIELE